ncbi:MAG: pepsin/retropepsin-like aspartic protease family protein [Terriglobales bacterium]
MAVSLFVWLSGCADSQPVPAQAPAPNGGVSSSATLAQPLGASELDAYIKNYDFEQLAKAVDAMPQSPDRDYFGGVLANRAGHVAESIELLTKVLPRLESSQPERAAVALQSLADDYVKTYRYNDAIRASEELLHKFASQLDKVERQDEEDGYRTELLLRDALPQMISFNGKVDLPIHRNSVVGTVETNLTINGVEQAWTVDTGAALSAVSASFAAKLGVRLSHDAAQAQGATGAESSLHVALLPEMKLGGATVRNVVLLVLDDKNLNVQIGKKTHYQIDAILGFPVLQALKRITFTHDGHFLAGPDSPSGQGGARLYMDELTPLLECVVENRKVVFSFDTGANESMLSDRYHREFPDAFQGLKKKAYAMAGAGGSKRTTAYYLPEVQLAMGQTHVVLHKVPVVPALGTDMDRTYGNLGRDLVDAYRGFTIDFESMRFLLGEKLTVSPK